MRTFRGCRVALCALTVLAVDASAQIPNPNRAVHPGIAPPASGLTPQAAPLLAVPDGVWNHGEGFGTNYADSGGWHGNTDGTDITLNDVHVDTGDIWVSFTAQNSLHPIPSCAMFRMEGYLRPAGLALPPTHPKYGAVPQGYVDQGAFEMFKPATAWQPSWLGQKKILIVIHAAQTVPFPANSANKRLEWRQMYRGFFSPDGLVRNEPSAGYASGQAFRNADANDDDPIVERPYANTIAAWTGGESYWPIEAYAVLPVMHRSTTLNEQRYLQLVHAIKLLLTENHARNPLGAANRLASLEEVEQHVVVAFIGGSNGGLQGSFAMLRYPHIVHGAFAYVFSPSQQRFYAEFDLDRALTRLSGVGMGPPGVTEDDFMTWNQYAWSQGLEMHDLSLTRLFLSGATYRPSCFAVGDEDTTSTGINWARVMDGVNWSPSGLRQSPSSFGSSAAHTFGWMAGENARHGGNVGLVANPYPSLNPTTYFGVEVCIDLWPVVIAQRVAELNQNPPVTIPIPALSPSGRNPAQQLRGLDDPQEWWLGRAGDALPAPGTNDPLELDTNFVDTVQAGATGAMPGGKEAMFVRDGRVYVGSADGFVSSFFVDTTITKHPLVRFARSPRLGHACFAVAPVAASGSWWVVAGTRRHLYKLDKDTLAVQDSVFLPYEVAEPHHITCADVLPGHVGPEIVFASVHGGLCFYDLNLDPIFEWPEPGIVEFFVDGGAVTFLSSRGVVATVTFSGSTHTATLEAVSLAIPRQLVTAGGPVDPPCQGVPHDLERMRVNWTGVGGTLGLATISLWKGDEDGNSVRGHWLPNLQAQPYLPNLSGCRDIAVCIEGETPNGIVGDHALVLLGDKLQLWDQYAQLVGEKSLVESTQGPYPFGAQAHRIAVGELVGNAGSYSEEVVIATNTGLMWMHIEELAASGTLLPASGNAVSQAHATGFWVESNGPALNPPAALPDTNVQARTNQALSATWAMARRPGTSGLDGKLHLLDQRGAYWRVAYDGSMELWRPDGPPGSRAWSYVTGVASSGGIQGHLAVLPFGPWMAVATRPYCPIESEQVLLEFTSPFVPNNWLQRDLGRFAFDGFLVYDMGGTALDKPPSVDPPGDRFESWHWTFAPVKTDAPTMDQWGNLVQGLGFEGTTSTGGPVTGVWSSTLEPDGNTKCPHHPLRSYNGSVVSITQQAIAAVDLLSGETAVILGCPGGRVRVIVPGAMRMDGTTPHALGSLDSTPDLGFGVSALAVRHEVQGSNELVRIWFGTHAHPDARPQNYTSSSGSLADSEVSAGAVHTVTWTPGTGFSLPVWTAATMHPTTAHPRGASSVTGMLVADVVPGSVDPVYGGDELVVATLSGDIILYDADTMVELWRTHVHGAAGCYNALRAEDLDGDGSKELYVAGSYGLWRFVQPGEL